MPIRVQTPGGIAEFPDGTDPQVIESALRERFPIAPMPAHGGDEPQPPSSWPRMPAAGRGTALDVRKSDAWARDNAPAIGATLATVATGGTGLIPMLAAGAGGAGGSLLRGDDATTALKQGALQGALEGGGQIVGAGLQKVAHGLMRGTVPKNIAKNFDGVDVAQEMLDRGAVPGLKGSAKRIEGLSRVANTERDAAAAAVPTMPRSKVIEGLRPIYQKGVTGKVPEMSDAALDAMRQSAREIGPSGLTGPQALARKDIMQDMGSAALRASDPSTAAFGSQLANAERGAIVSHLRDTPRMANALSNSQALMAIDQVMQDAAHSNPITRMRLGGLTAGATAPAGLAVTAHALNQGAKVVDPNVARVLMMLLRQRSDQ